MPSVPGSQMLAGKSSEHRGDGHTLFSVPATWCYSGENRTSDRRSREAQVQ